MEGHVSVLLDEVLDAFSVLPDDKSPLVLDATFGGGGHTEAMLRKREDAHVVALDCDADALPRVERLKNEFADRLSFHSINFADLRNIPEKGFDFCLFDLGLSSFQFDTADRGFSFRKAAPNDMRLNQREGITAAEFLETADRQDLVEAVRNYGEEPRWRAVVDAIIDARGTGILSDTTSFAELVARTAASPRRGRGPTIHPATKTFQGIRIAVNSELSVIEKGLPAAFRKMRPGGYMAVISFHSLEDRIVKRFYRRMAGRPEHGRDNSSQMERKVRARLITRKPITAGDAELSANPRSRSAKLRILQKLLEP
jgi:16S rRNA (cytosine1402-N4)-methyltransferase